MTSAFSNLRLKRALAAIGALDTARGVRDVFWAMRFVRPNLRYWKRGAPDGLPIPPQSLRIAVAASPDIGWFLHSGHRGKTSVEMALAHNGVDVASYPVLLDFGCGCGRVTRYWAGHEGEVHGSDVNPRLIAWCRRNLRFGHFETNDPTPPLNYRDSRFDLVYALSVFTHLPENLQEPWVAELERILKPGGLLVLTTHGQAYLSRLDSVQQRLFLDGHLVVKSEGPPGSNSFGAYHPETWVRERFAKDLDVLDFVAEGALGNPTQDLWVFRKPS